MDYKIYHAEDIAPFGEGDYQSRLLLDHAMAGEKAVNINHGTVASGGRTAAAGSIGASHERAEVYFGVSGKANVYLNGKPVVMKPGTLIYIPGGTYHYIVNRSKRTPFTLLTIWADEADNETHAARLKAWGTSYRTVSEAERGKA